MSITADKLKDFGLVDKVLTEPLGGAHRDPKAMSEIIRNSLLKNLDELNNLSKSQLLRERQQRLASFGQFQET